jgi:nickel/cobalt transporter (NicO) family protein
MYLSLAGVKLMRRSPLIPFVLIVLFAVLSRVHGALADPFNGTHVVPPNGVDMFLMPGGVVATLAHIQMQLNDVISREFETVHGTGSIGAALTILALAFLYGAVHAAVPGHGKTVVGSYFVTNGARWRSGFVMGGLISAIKGATAIALVLLLSLVLHLKELETANQGATIGCVSYALVAVIGCVVFWQAATGRGCGHSHHGHHEALGGDRHDVHDPAEHRHAAPHNHLGFQRTLIIVTGLVPCSSAIVIMLFALANNAMAMGIAAVLALSLGMAVTVSTVGMAGIAARPILVWAFAGGGRHLARAEQTAQLLGAALMVGFGGLLMVGALSRI